MLGISCNSYVLLPSAHEMIYIVPPEGTGFRLKEVFKSRFELLICPKGPKGDCPVNVKTKVVGSRCGERRGCNRTSHSKFMRTALMMLPVSGLALSWSTITWLRLSGNFVI